MVLAGSDVGEFLMNLRGDLSGLPVSDRTAVDLGDGDDFRGGTGKPDLVGGRQLEPGDGTLADLVSEVLGDLDDGCPGDTLEDALCDGRGEDLSEFVHEDVLSGALGDVSLLVQHNGLVGTLTDGLPLGKTGCDIGTVDLSPGGTA